MYNVNRPHGRVHRNGTATDGTDVCMHAPVAPRPRLEDRPTEATTLVHPGVAYTHSHTTPHRLARMSEIWTVSEAYWLARAPVPISGSRGSHGGLGGRSEIATPNGPFFAGSGRCR